MILPVIIPLYLDPGSGSILLQLLVAGLAAVSLFLATSWRKIKSIFRKDMSKVREDDEEEYDD